eukprot:gene24913-30099_t
MFKLKQALLDLSPVRSPLNSDTITVYAPDNSEDALKNLLSIDDAAMEKFLSYVLTLAPNVQSTLAINIVIFLLWQLNGKFMLRHAAISNKNWKEGRWWSAILGSFSHSDLYHIVGNMSILLSIGARVHAVIGDKAFAGVILGSSIICSGLTLLYNYVVARLRPDSKVHQQSLSTPHIGFSGINCTLLYLYTAINPSLLVLYGFTSHPAITLKDMFFLGLEFDLTGLAISACAAPTPISHIGHLSGVCAGVLLRLFLTVSAVGRRLIGKKAVKSLSQPLFTFKI